MRAPAGLRRGPLSAACIAIALLLPAAAPDQAAAIPTVYIDPPATIADSGEVFDVGIRINEDADTFSNFQVIVRFDPAVLFLQQVFEGSLYTSYSGQRFFVAEEESLGTWEIFDVIFPAMSFVVAPGELARLRFQALADGCSFVEFLSVSLRDIERDPILPVASEGGVVLVGETAVGVGGPPELGGSWTLGPPAPNPSAGVVRLFLGRPPGALSNIRLAVYDAGGRLVRDLSSEGFASSGRLEWDGRDRGGREAPPGVYFVRLAAGDRTFTRKLLRVR